MSKSKGISDSNRNKSYSNKVFFKDARKMGELPNNSINLIITSPPYFNIKDYSKDGKQEVIKRLTSKKIS